MMAANTDTSPMAFSAKVLAAYRQRVGQPPTAARILAEGCLPPAAGLYSSPDKARGARSKLWPIGRQDPQGHR
jgi:hypothetical protein